MRTILKILLIAAGLLTAAHFVPGIRIDTFWIAVMVAVVLALLNVLIKPILIILTLPVTIITLGLFTLVINALLFWLASALIAGFSVSGFLPAFLGALIVSVVSFAANRILND